MLSSFIVRLSADIMEGPIQNKSFLEPERIVRTFDLEPGDHVADFGSGHGYFTIPMARIVGGDGKVYSIDVQKETLDIIRARAKVEHLLNIESVWADLDQPNGSKLKDRFLDFVLIANLLFQSEHKEILFREAYRILREGGHVGIVEWDETPAPLGPPQAVRLRKETARRMALEAGFQMDREFEAGNHHYGLLFTKK